MIKTVEAINCSQSRGYSSTRGMGPAGKGQLTPSAWVHLDLRMHLVYDDEDAPLIETLMKSIQLIAERLPKTEQEPRQGSSGGKRMSPRMWIGIAGTDIGVAIDTDPAKTREHNLQVAVGAAAKLLGTEGLSAVAKIPDRTGVAAWIPAPSSISKAALDYLKFQRQLQEMRLRHKEEEAEHLEKMEPVWRELTETEVEIINKT